MSRSAQPSSRPTLAALCRTPGVDGEPPVDTPIAGICADSRRLRPGEVFVAVRGYATDGHRYIPQAVEAGAAAVVLEDRTYLASVPPQVVAVPVPNSRRAAAALAAAYHDHPSRNLTLVGVTGTNGKTTISLMLDSIFAAGGAHTGVIGTLGRGVLGTWRATERTTPDAIELQSLLAEMRDVGATHVAMEVSSHALELERVYSCSFAGAIFTNLTQDHLDFHSGLDEYLAAKQLLFTSYAQSPTRKGPMVGAINMDDPAGRQVARAAQCTVVGYGTNGGSQVRARSIDIGPGGVTFTIDFEGHARRVKLQLTGLFNVHNALGAAACCYGLGLDIDQIVAGLRALQAVPGRFERVDEGQPFTVVVDYAHTPGALQNVLTAARALSPSRIVCVMGCGGDRDRSKRPMMGKIAAEMSDLTIVTSDNPRTEDPLKIIDDVVGGITQGEYLVEPDRGAAIIRAVAMCAKGDILVIAGKGHETYQEFADHRIDFDDREVARRALRA